MVKHDVEKNGVSAPTAEKQEDLMDMTGGEGPWQRWIFVLACMCSFPDSSHNMAMAFLAPNLDHWCSRPPDVNMSVQAWKAIAVPPEDKHCSRYLDYAHVEDDPLTNISSPKNTLGCDSWEYDNSVYKSTVLSQFNLVCDREWLISLSKSVFIAGYFLSATVFGYLADKFGRKPIIGMCNVIALVSAIISMFSSSFLMFAITRFFIASGVTGLDNITYVLMMEIVTPKHRSAYGVGYNIGWILGMLSLPGIAWLFRDWIYMQIALTLPFTIIFFCWWWIPESPRWLLAHGKTEEAAKILSKAAKRNRVDLNEAKLKEEISKTTKVHESSEDEKVNILQLFKPGLFQKTVIVLYLWFTNAFVYYGISYNTNDLAGDPFLNFALYALMEVPACPITIYVIQSKGRRRTEALFCLAAGLSCWVMYPIPKDPWWMSEVVSLFGKFCITCSFSILYVLSAEIFPTTLRTVGMGSSQVCARTGAIIAPFVREIGKASHPIVPQLIFGFLAATAGLLSLLLPETKDRVIPDTIKEAAQVMRKKAAKDGIETAVVLKDLKNRSESTD